MYQGVKGFISDLAKNDTLFKATVIVASVGIGAAVGVGGFALVSMLPIPADLFGAAFGIMGYSAAAYVGLIAGCIAFKQGTGLMERRIDNRIAATIRSANESVKTPMELFGWFREARNDAMRMAGLERLIPKIDRLTFLEETLNSRIGKWKEYENVLDSAQKATYLPPGHKERVRLELELKDLV